MCVFLGRGGGRLVWGGGGVRLVWGGGGMRLVWGEIGMGVGGRLVFVHGGSVVNERYAAVVIIQGITDRYSRLYRLMSSLIKDSTETSVPIIQGLHRDWCPHYSRTPQRLVSPLFKDSTETGVPIIQGLHRLLSSLLRNVLQTPYTAVCTSCSCQWR